MRKSIKIGSQFSGVGAFEQSLIRLGIDFKNIYAADWDKYARQTYLLNFEEPEYYVKDVHDTPIKEITEKHGSLDIAMFSPPCQAFSLAGKRKGEDSINFEHTNSKTRRGRVGVGVGQTLTTSCNQGVAIGAIRGRNIDNPKSRESGLPTIQMLEINENNVSNCLTTVQKDNVVIEPIIYRIGNYSKSNHNASSIIDRNGISPTVMENHGTVTAVNTFDYRIRKLTPRECFRLMDFPESFDFSCVSDSQAYKQAGNSIVVNVLSEIIKKLKL